MLLEREFGESEVWVRKRLFVEKSSGMYFIIRGRREMRQEQITAVKTSMIDQRVRSTSSPILLSVGVVRERGGGDRTGQVYRAIELNDVF